MSVGQGTNFAGMTRDEKIKELVTVYGEASEEIGQLMDGFDLMVKALRTMKMPEAQIWATIVVSTADELGLDLDTPNGMAAAAVLAAYGVRS